MVLNKQEFAGKFGRWVEDNEIVIEDLSEAEILNIAGKMAKKGYSLEYWKAPKQDSGHLHIKDIKFPEGVDLTNSQMRFYKFLIMKKYVSPESFNKVDMNFVKQKRHRIAEENKEHFKGYGVKSLIRSWNHDKVNWSEQDLFNQAIRLKQGSNDNTQIPLDTEELRLMTYADLKKIKKDKNFIVQDFLKPKSVTMIYSPPAQFKSLIASSLAMSVSTGKTWLNLKTKKQPILYLNGEMSEQIFKDYLEKLHFGMNLKRNNFPFYILNNGILLDSKKKVHLGFLIALERVIEEKGIKVLIFDTLHRFAYYDENRADDINILYTKVFKPLIQSHGISIVFLHHSTKAGDYRGSGDFLGMVDVSYKIYRYGKTDKFKIVNEKSRSGEIADITGTIDFGEDYIKIIRGNEKAEQEQSLSKLKETTERIRSMFKPGQELRRKDILDKFEIEGKEVNIKLVQRSLKFLVDNQFLDKTEKGVYNLILR